MQDHDPDQMDMLSHYSETLGDTRSSNAPRPAPRQIAIALEYDPLESDAPLVKATGKGAIAEQILQVAFANNVRVRKDAPLAEILSMLEVDSPIPLEAFATVAEILTYVYEADARRAGATSQ